VDGRTGRPGARALPRAKEQELYLEPEVVVIPLLYSAGKNVTEQTAVAKLVAAWENVQVMQMILL